MVNLKPRSLCGPGLLTNPLRRRRIGNRPAPAFLSQASFQQGPAGFHKSAVLFNLHRAVVDNEPRAVVVVEGFFDCLRVYQAGFPCVALMGCSMSERQEKLLASHFRAALLVLDGDDAGRTAADEVAARLVRRMFVKVVSLADGKQPDMLTVDELRELLN